MINSSLIDIINFWEEVQKETKSKNYGVSDFITYLEDNNWFETNPVVLHTENKDIIKIPTEFISLYKKSIVSFLERISLSDEEMLEYLLCKLGEKYPDTSETMREFIKESKPNLKHIIQITDFLITYMSEEIHKMDKLEQILDQFSSEMAIAVGRTFTEYLNWLKNKRITKYEEVSLPNINRNEGRNTKYAYNFETCLRLYYVLFSPQSIEENDFYTLIADNPKSAVALLFLSLHMICALRDEDLKRIRHPKLMDAPQNVLDSIKNRTIKDTDAIVAVEKILREIEILQPKPNKTSRHSGIPYVKLFIPESIKVHFGYLFLAAEAHYLLKENKKKQYYIYPITTYEEFEKYLGDDIAEIFWDNDYSAQSFNKAYMQLSQQYIDSDLSGNQTIKEHPIGYMFAAFARSHKASYEEFASMTATYLKDRAATGHTMEFIIKELTERGVCSFVVSELLETLYGRDYSQLSMKEQSKAIQTFSLTPYEIESSVLTYEAALKNASLIVSELLQGSQKEKQDSANRILNNISLGTAVSKETDVMCLMTAFGKDCPYTSRKQCIGCKYEILTKGAMYTLVYEYQRNLNLYKEAENEILKNKYSTIIRQVITPVIKEMLIYMEKKVGNDSVEEFEQIVKGVLNLES
ncbi:hypothetical protein [Aminipila sp.]|uniref:hypothetical protein n=1 Tax=Aminipila sp. TaxID=2060095 RepID=UPI00289B8BB0|nr:hypothetical protein [Aminipila sp.]